MIKIQQLENKIKELEKNNVTEAGDEIITDKKKVRKFLEGNKLLVELFDQGVIPTIEKIDDCDIY